jgi:hypothetical protein
MAAAGGAARAAHRGAVGVTSVYSWQMARAPGSGGAAAASGYSTSFPNTENPLSDSGNLVCPSTIYSYYQAVRTTPGKCFGVGASAVYDDCVVRTAAGLGISTTSHYSRAVVHRTGGYTPPSTHEVEIVLMVSETASTLKLYEGLFAFGSTFTAVRWNGTGGDFTVAGTGSWTDSPDIDTGAATNVQHGDVVEGIAEIVGGSPRLTFKLNGTTFWRCTDTSGDKLTSGQPGLSFFARSGTGLDMAAFCFSSWEAGTQ